MTQTQLDNVKDIGEVLILRYEEGDPPRVWFISDRCWDVEAGDVLRVSDNSGSGHCYVEAVEHIHSGLTSVQAVDLGGKDAATA